jgi:hypothetical protein
MARTYPGSTGVRRGIRPGKIADPGKSAGAVEEAPVGGDVGTVGFHREGEEEAS